MLLNRCAPEKHYKNPDSDGLAKNSLTHRTGGDAGGDRMEAGSGADTPSKTCSGAQTKFIFYCLPSMYYIRGQQTFSAMGL